ncbi:hypothetical protein B0920_22400 [Massilia sp. KIM]|uniref:hypothetical protein n=1 Tax=Massilia sp. KIM TaxID=1955422 RepID=UPI00098F36E9|nr:hypothetical protein [Massilia sp. KIM]OON60020.1 hypothetical protein B0920_22400 [Massilia sp. KIM]
MLSKPLRGAALALAAWIGAGAPAAAQATIEHWNFMWTGFEVSTPSWNPPRWVPDQRLGGTFTGSDADGDGILEASELTEFVVGAPVLGCINNATQGCTLDHFAYDTASGELSFATTSFFIAAPETQFRSDTSTVTGELQRVYWTQPGDDMWWEYRWTSQTSFALSPAPEPAAPALALAGLAVLAPVLRRRLRAGKGA